MSATTTFSDKRPDTHVTGTDIAAPARGDAVTSLTYAGGKSTLRELHFDHGRQTLTQPFGKPTAKPGKTLPRRFEWISNDNTTPSYGTGYTDEPFSLTALLMQADTGVPAPCPSGLTAARCYTALIVTKDGGDPRSGIFTGSQHRSGRPYLVLHVGVDEQGRPAFIRVPLAVRTLGTPDQVLTGTTRFTAYATTPPPPVTRPDPATIAPDTDLDY